LFLAAFNMIPAFPMDGGRVLRAALATQLGHVRATEVSASIGQWVAFALGFFGLFYNPLLIFIAIFVYLAAASEAHMVGLRAASRGVPVTAAMLTRFATLNQPITSTRRSRPCCRPVRASFPSSTMPAGSRACSPVATSCGRSRHTAPKRRWARR
jgi:stage IV sporulation protein FB